MVKWFSSKPVDQAGVKLVAPIESLPAVSLTVSDDTSRYAESLEPSKFVIMAENLIHGDAELLIRITHCGLCQYDTVHYKRRFYKVQTTNRLSL